MAKVGPPPGETELDQYHVGRTVPAVEVPEKYAVDARFLGTNDRPSETCPICTIRLTNGGFPMFVRWDGGDMRCENASDIYEAIWTALGNPRIGDFLLRVVPHLYPEEPE